jgi:hypothetical protein
MPYDKTHALNLGEELTVHLEECLLARGDGVDLGRPFQDSLRQRIDQNAQDGGCPGKGGDPALLAIRLADQRDQICIPMIPKSESAKASRLFLLFTLAGMDGVKDATEMREIKSCSGHAKQQNAITFRAARNWFNSRAGRADSSRQKAIQQA